MSKYHVIMADDHSGLGFDIGVCGELETAARLAVARETISNFNCRKDNEKYNLDSDQIPHYNATIFQKDNGEKFDTELWLESNDAELQEKIVEATNLLLEDNDNPRQFDDLVAERIEYEKQRLATQ